MIGQCLNSLTFELPMMLHGEGFNSLALALEPWRYPESGSTAKRGYWSKRGMLPILGGVFMLPVLRFFFARLA